VAKVRQLVKMHLTFNSFDGTGVKAFVIFQRRYDMGTMLT